MNKARFIALCLAFALTAALFAGCASIGNSSSTTATTTDDTAATTAEQTTAAVNYNGYEFTVQASFCFPQYNEDGSFKDSLSEELAGKLEALEKELNIKITKIDNPDSWLETVTSAAMGGTKIADLLYERQDRYWPAARAGALIAADSDDAVNAGLNCKDETRWFWPAVRESKMFDKYWGLQVASKYCMETSGYFVCFNKDLVASAGDYDLYQLTRDMKWTWEVYRTIAKVTTKDTTGDGVPDIWGTGATAWGNEIISFDQQFIGQNADGKWVLTINTPQGIAALENLKGFNADDGTRWDAGSGDCRKAFANGTITFNFANQGHINGAGSAIYDSNHDYGIVPMPLSEGVTQYASGNDNNRCFVLQAANKDLASTISIANEWALILNDSGSGSWKDRFDDGRCRTDADKEMMLTYIVPNFCVNVACMSEEIWDAVDEGIVSGVCYDGKTVQQAIEEQEPVINALLNDFFKQ